MINDISSITDLLQFYNQTGNSSDLDSYNQIYNFSVKSYNNEIPAIRFDVALFLSFITSIIKPMSILEIGFGSGVSLYFITKNLSKIHYNMISLEKDKLKCEIGNELLERLNLNGNIQIVNVLALDYLKHSCNMYDFVFIDGPKKEYLEQFMILEDRINHGGVIICDNVLFNGNLIKSESDIKKSHIPIKKSMISFNEYLIQSKKFKTSFFNIGDGLSLSVKL